MLLCFELRLDFLLYLFFVLVVVVIKIMCVVIKKKPLSLQFPEFVILLFSRIPWPFPSNMYQRLPTTETDRSIPSYPVRQTEACIVITSLISKLCCICIHYVKRLADFEPFIGLDV
jgi:hypothetical protein